MKANLVLLLPQELQADYFSNLHEQILEKLCKCGLEIISINAVYNKETLLNRIDYYFSLNTVFVSQNIGANDSIIPLLNQKYATSPKTANFGYIWSGGQSTCVFFDIDKLDFSKIDENEIVNLYYSETIRQTFRIFGIERETVFRFLKTFNKYEEINYTIFSSYLDTEIHFFVKKSFQNSKEYKFFLRDLNEILENYIYSYDDTLLEDVLIDIFSVRNKKLVICDCLSQGKIVSDMCKNKHILNFISDKIIIFEDNDYQNLLGFSKSYLFGGNYKFSEMAYEVCARLCEKYENNIVLCLFGTKAKPFIAVGDNEEIHVFKAKFLNQQFSLKTIELDCYFKLIKKLNKKLLSF